MSVDRRLEHVRVEDAGRSVEIPVVSLDSGAPGPTVVIGGNVHGDEFTGVLAAHELLDHVSAGLARGRVHLYPSLNPPGLLAHSRGVGSGGPDLNRQFPGRRNGDLAQRLARGIWEDLVRREPALLIDLHADSSGAIPYAIVDRAVRRIGDERDRLQRDLRRYADATGLTVIHEYPDDLYLRFGLDRSLAGAMVNHLGVPAVTIESGPRRVVNMEAVQVTVRAVLRLLVHLEMIAREVPPEAARIAGGPWRRTSGPRTSEDGLFVPSIPPGTRVERGALLGVIRGLDGQVVEEVRATGEGLVISWVDGAWLTAGTVVATLGIPDGR